jgi:hypothetical protein
MIGSPVLTGIGLADSHNINSTNAAILAVYLDYSRSRTRFA